MRKNEKIIDYYLVVVYTLKKRGDLMDKYDNSYAYLNTYKCESYNINYQNDELIIEAINPIPEKLKTIEQNDTSSFISKKDIFNRIFKLGKQINDILKDIELTDNFISFVEDETNYIDNKIFNKLDELIYNNKEIKDTIINFFNDYGIMEWYGKSKPFDYELYKLKKDRELSNTFVVQEGINESIYLDYFSGNIDLTTYSMNIIPYINLSLLIYYIYNMKDVISNVKTKNLLNAIKIFPYLKDKYYEMCFIDKETNEANIDGNVITKKAFQYNKKYALEVNNYLKLLVIKTTKYISNNIFILNDNKILFNEENIPVDKTEINTYNYSFFTNLYIMSNPFLTAYEYLLQILPNQQGVPPFYTCDNCNSVLEYKSLLCINCKKDIVENAKVKYLETKKDKDKKLYKELEKEFFEVSKDKYSPTPRINKNYKEKENSKRYYYNGGNKLKKEKYNEKRNNQ